jgi:hypothetical protein
MSKPSDTAMSNLKRLVGEVLGDSKLVAKGERQRGGRAFERSDEEHPSRRLSDIEIPT